MKRVIVVGFDGLDPKIVSRLLAAGELPHFRRLSQSGSLASMATTQPAETPVAFATFSTGTNPGAHGIFDFVRRDPATYLLDHALNRYEQKSRFLPPIRSSTCVEVFRFGNCSAMPACRPSFLGFRAAMLRTTSAAGCSPAWGCRISAVG